MSASLLHPAAVDYLVIDVNCHLETFHASQGEERRRLKAELAQVETELTRIAETIVSGMACFRHME